MADLVGTGHFRSLFAQDDEGNGDHAVGDAAAEVAGIDDPDQHLLAEERRDDGQEADEQERVDRRLIFVVQFRKDMWNHVRFSHGIHGAAAADEEGVPTGDDTAETADDEDLGHDGAAKGDSHSIGRNQAADAFHGDGDFRIIHDIADTADNEGIEENGQNNGQNQDTADFLQGYGNFFRCLRNDIEADEIERRHDGNGQSPFEHIRRRSPHEQLTFQVGRRTGQGRCGDEQDTDAADDDRQDGLQDGRRLGPDDIDGRNEDRNQNSYGQPGSVNVEAGNGIHITRQEIRINISDDRRQCAGFKADDADIAEDDHPRTNKGTNGPHGLITEDVFATALRHGRRQFRIGQADEEDHDAADSKSQHSAEDTAFHDPVACRYDPAPADHSAKGDDQDVPGTQDFIKIRLFCSHLSYPLKSLQNTFRRRI